MQSGDVTDTFADVTRLEALIARRPATLLREGVERFVAWYLDYHAHRGINEQADGSVQHGR